MFSSAATRLCAWLKIDRIDATLSLFALFRQSHDGIKIITPGAGAGQSGLTASARGRPAANSSD
jgi:hypothetical protein